MSTLIYTVSMKTKKTLYFLGAAVVLLGLVMGIADMQRKAESSQSLNDISFSTTMAWGAEYQAYLDRPLTTAILRERIALVPAPTNNSSETAREIEDLRYLHTKRTEALENSIRNEVNLAVTDFFGEPMEKYFDASLHPETSAVLNYAWSDLGVIIMQEKLRFDRVRPHILAPDLDPVVEVPPHPSYPSGHSAQAHFFARVLSEIYPERAIAYLARADEIAFHREVAGVHYRSDSAAGALLAEQLFSALKDDPEFIRLLEEAKQLVKRRDI